MIDMRILTWNIQNGGLHASFESIINHLMQHKADMVVLTEFWDNPKGAAIKKGLFAMGYTFQNTHVSPYKMDCVFIASKIDFYDVTDTKHPNIPYERWVELYIPEKELYVLGVHIPNYLTRVQDRDCFCENLVLYAKSHKEDQCVIIGDYNTSLTIDSQGPPRGCQQLLPKLVKNGWTDSWRMANGNQAIEYSYEDDGGYGFRLDYAYISPSLKHALSYCHFSHEERFDQSSDHSALLVDLNI
ncbi:endonuclease/exonuclease/phosphatase family protein [Bacillus sp. 1P06AnD]|uniref:endonuclease/exonuclease/phosphatase family protein n=1 Tax=Bacillus sp. 1P06AnD TaxID=3132208 RepID=UPI00399F2A78